MRTNPFGFRLIKPVFKTTMKIKFNTAIAIVAKAFSPVDGCRAKTTFSHIKLNFSLRVGFYES